MTAKPFFLGMSRLIVIACFAAGAWGFIVEGNLSAAPTIQVTVQTNLAGLSFTVDGTPYSSTQTFSWVRGSSHTIATTSPQSGGSGVQDVWTNWSGGGGISHNVSPTSKHDLHGHFYHPVLFNDEQWSWWHGESQ